MGNYLPWTNGAMNRRAITETRQKRAKRFEEVKLRVREQDAHIRDEVLSLSFLQLRDALQNDRFTCEIVLMAYAWKALECQDTHNCLCEFLIESFEEAKELDNRFYRKMGKPVLWGIPFSVKGNFFMAGYDCCIGLAQLLNNPKTETCTFVTHLRNLGCIPFVTTNVPQTLISFVCSNSVYGTTGNPLDVKRTPGGSSGGEACLTALRGTPFGVGSDLAGSLRIPANFCGLITLKPTQDRFLVENAMTGLPGRGRLGLSHGYFTRTLEEQVYLLRHTYGNEAYCKIIPKNPALPLKENVIEETSHKHLRIGYYLDDGFCKPVPACARVVKETVEKLKSQGHELILFKVPNPSEAADILYKSILPEGGAYFSKLFNYDIVDTYLQEFATLLKVPKFVRWLASFPLNVFSSQASIMAKSYVETAEDVRLCQENVDAYVRKFTSFWKELDIDALILPAFPVTPVPHDYPSKLGCCAFSTALYNMLDFPVGIVPTGKVTEEDDNELADETKWPTGYNFIYKIMRKAAANSKGMPLSVQIATLPYQEEECLGVMKIVEKLWS